MGLLDDLARQSEKKQAQEKIDQLERDEREYHFRTRTRPTMARLYDYLRELCELLTYLKRETTVHYAIPRYGQVSALIDPDFRLNLSRDHGRVTIHIRLEAEIDEANAPVTEFEKHQILEDVKAYLHQHGLRSEINQKSGLDGEFMLATVRVHGRIHMKGVIDADVESNKVNFEFTNFDQFGTTSKQVKLSAIDDAFLDQLGRYIAREDDTYLREAMDDETLNAIRERLSHDNRRRTSELELAEEMARRSAERAQAMDGNSLIGKLRRMSARLLGGR